MSKNRSTRAVQKQRKQNSRIIILVSLAGVLLVTLAVFLSLRRPAPLEFAPEVRGAPSLKPDQESIDLGNVPLGQTVEASFNLTNVGDRTLRFTRAPYIEVLEGC